MSATVKDVLVKARETIRTPDRWTKNVSWRSASGRPTGDRASVASCCMLGAIWFHVPSGTDVSDKAASLLRSQVTIGDLALWNDDPNRTHAEVLAAFDKAIELAGAAE